MASFITGLDKSVYYIDNPILVKIGYNEIINFKYFNVVISVLNEGGISETVVIELKEIGRAHV